MINKITPSKRFLRDLKKLHKKHYHTESVISLINKLSRQDPLTNHYLKRKYDDHALHGNLQGYRELHVEHDLILMYKIINQKELGLARITSHDQLFK